MRTIHDKARSLAGGSWALGTGVEPVRTRIARKVEIEGTILLEEHKDILDAIANQLQLLLRRDRGLTGRVDDLRGNQGARSWSEGHIRKGGNRLVLRFALRKAVGSPKLAR